MLSSDRVNPGDVHLYQGSDQIARSESILISALKRVTSIRSKFDLSVTPPSKRVVDELFAGGRFPLSTGLLASHPLEPC